MKPPAKGTGPAGDLAREIEAISLLDDAVRRRVYFYVAAAFPDVDRDTVAADVGISRGLAAFHLDKLAEHGLLAISFRRVTGRAGRGAGRPRKFYRRSERDLALNVPQRDYELIARLFADALDSAGQRSLAALAGVARANGAALGRTALERAAPEPSRRSAVESLLPTLALKGFDPVVVGRDVYLRNCPFHSLARSHGDLVCTANQALLSGFLEGAGASGVTASLERAEGRCCVVLRQS